MNTQHTVAVTVNSSGRGLAGRISHQVVERSGRVLSVLVVFVAA